VDSLGIIGNGDYLGRFPISLPIAAVIGFGVAQTRSRASTGYAVLVALAGDTLIPGGIILLLFASVGIGTGCLD